MPPSCRCQSAPAATTSRPDRMAGKLASCTGVISCSPLPTGPAAAARSRSIWRIRSSRYDRTYYTSHRPGRHACPPSPQPEGHLEQDTELQAEKKRRGRRAGRSETRKSSASRPSAARPAAARSPERDARAGPCRTASRPTSRSSPPPASGWNEGDWPAALSFRRGSVSDRSCVFVSAQRHSTEGLLEDLCS